MMGSIHLFTLMRHVGFGLSISISAAGGAGERRDRDRSSGSGGRRAWICSLRASVQRLTLNYAGRDHNPRKFEHRAAIGMGAGQLASVDPPDIGISQHPRDHASDDDWTVNLRLRRVDVVASCVFRTKATAGSGAKPNGIPG
jgi:hypothetical protein